MRGYPIKQRVSGCCVTAMSAVVVPAQPVGATQAVNFSAGVSNCKVSRGRSSLVHFPSRRRMEGQRARQICGNNARGLLTKAAHGRRPRRPHGKTAQSQSFSDCRIGILTRSNHRALEERGILRVVGQPVERALPNNGSSRRPAR